MTISMFAVATEYLGHTDNTEGSVDSIEVAVGRTETIGNYLAG